MAKSSKQVKAAWVVGVCALLGIVGCINPSDENGDPPSTTQEPPVIDYAIESQGDSDHEIVDATDAVMDDVPAKEEHQVEEVSPESLEITQMPQEVTSDATTEDAIVEDSNLPLKATCKDGTIQYQDNPSLPNYRGMCSHHGGIIVRHGRVP